MDASSWAVAVRMVMDQLWSYSGIQSVVGSTSILAWYLDHRIVVPQHMWLVVNMLAQSPPRWSEYLRWGVSLEDNLQSLELQSEQLISSLASFGTALLEDRRCVSSCPRHQSSCCTSTVMLAIIYKSWWCTACGRVVNAIRSHITVRLG